MNIQIFGKNKCFDTKKAQRYFKEIDTLNKLGYKAKINTHTTSYIN